MNVRIELRAAVESFAALHTARPVPHVHDWGPEPGRGGGIDENTEQNHSCINRDSSMCTDLKGELFHANKLTRYSEKSNYRTANSHILIVLSSTEP
jgi:hypothetical protein